MALVCQENVSVYYDFLIKTRRRRTQCWFIYLLPVSAVYICINKKTKIHENDLSFFSSFFFLQPSMEPIVNLRQIDYGRVCIFCLKNTDRLSKATDHGLEKVKHAARTRSNLKDSKNSVLIERLNDVMESAEAQTYVWHKMCYAHFTDKSKLERLQNSQIVDSEQEASCSTPSQQEQAECCSRPNDSRQEASCSRRVHMRRSLRKDMEPVNWNLCMFCQIDVLKKKLKSVMTKQLSDQIIQNSHFDYKIGLRLAAVIDLIAAEAKYHLTCLRAFIRSTDKTKQEMHKNSENSDNPDLAIIWLCKELQQAADKGHVILLDDVWERYKVLAEDSTTTIPLSYCSRRATFSEKLQSQLGDIFNFFQPLDKSPSERKTILIPTKYVSTVANTAVFEMMESEDTLPQYLPKDNSFLSLVHVALKIRKDLIETPGHKGFSVSEDDAIACIPDSLYMLLRLIFGGQEALEDDNSEKTEDLLRSRVLSAAQDLVYCVSGGRKWTPKHIGLATTLHQATRSKQLVELFSKAGHCLNYEQVLQVDSALAESTLKSMDPATGTIIPPNMVADHP